MRFLLAFGLLASILASASRASAAEAPIVYHSTLANHANPGVAALVDGSQTLELYLEIGAVSTNTVNREVCVDGEGDELCGFTLVLEATGGVSLVEFCPTNLCASGLVHHLDPATGVLRINRLGPAIDQAQTPFYVGRVVVDATGVGGELRVAAESQAVSARLQALGVRDAGPLAIYLPEPGVGLGLAGGLGLLFGTRRARRACDRGPCRSARRHRVHAARSPARAGGRSGRRAGVLFGFALLAGLAPPGARAQQFNDLTTFTTAVSALGSPPARQGFETVPLSPTGFGALGQGVRLGPLTLRSLALGSDVDLAFVPGAPLGLLGTLLVAGPPAAGDPALHPGGASTGSGARGDDDVRVAFDVPMRAAGLRILGNVSVAGEVVRFLDAANQVVASVTMPGLPSPPGASGFVGYLIQPGDAPIRAIVVDESAVDLDDIAVDEIVYASTADAYADAVNVFSPVIVAGEPIAPNLDPAQSLGPPDLQTVSLGSGGKLTVRFVDNVLTGSGDALPDLRIHEADPQLEGSHVAVSANGASFTSVGTIAGGTQSIDLDAYGFDAGDQLFFVRIIDDAAQGPTGGPSVGADIDAVEALSGTWLPPDGDGDHVADDYDVCPSHYDEAQRDSDADGLGDLCDNCPFVFNPGQQDEDSDGEGDACEPARIRLIRDFTPTVVEGKADLGELRIDCGATDVGAIVVGLWVPPGPAGFDFGGGCEAPQAGFEPPGAPTGVGCTGPGILLGATVGPARSGAFGVPLGDPMPPAARPDVIYVSLRGSVANGNKLCSALERDVPLARLRAFAPLALSPGAVASISLEDVYQAGWCAIEDGTGACAARAFGTYALTSTLPAIAELRLQPAAGQASTTAVDWDVCIADTTATYMHRVTLGLLGPVDATYASLFLDDCLIGPSGSGRRDCGGEIGTAPDWVDESVSFTQGPLVASAPDLLADTLYTPLDGGAPGIGGGDVLNPYLGLDACIGIVTNDEPPATPGAPPILVRDGFFDLAYHDAGTLGPEPYQTAEGVLQALDGARVYETIVFNSGDDLDGDGFTDPVDNCPFTANPDQADDGGFLSTAPNGVGNACECGDANGSGRVVPASQPETGAGGTPLVPDLQLIREYLVGMHPDDPAIPLRCSLAGDTACDTVDAVVLERALQGLNANPVPRCDAAVD
ncbi:MAG: thrombospondin type 3 repeat-containing protein [Myxococcota bacterium]